MSEVPAEGGGSPPGPVVAPCCHSRTGTHEISNRFDRVFQKYGRSKTWFTSDPQNAANLPGGVDWEAYYYGSAYKYKLAYTTLPGAPGAGCDGKITITLRCKATVHAVPPELLTAAPPLFKTVTPADITAAFGPWNAAIQTHWTSRYYTVLLGAPDCPGKFTMEFSAVEDAGNPHINFTVINMVHPQDVEPWKTVLANPAHALHQTAQNLARQWRSNTAKFNIGDSRGTLVFAHEFGHYMGWGDEYVEITGRNMNPPTNRLVALFTSRTGGNLLYDSSNGPYRPLRVALRIHNPTRNYRSANSSELQDLDLTASGHYNWLMSNMVEPVTYQPRFVYTIVHDFIEKYNADWYGGGTSAHCIDVRITP